MDRLVEEHDASAWPEREARWKRKLRRLRLDAEPIEEQLERHRRVTIALSAVSALIGLMFLAIFAAFGRPDVGAVVSGVLVVPVVGLAWVDHAILEARASAYLRERAAHFSKANPPG
jgi:hypothetical protein